MRLHLRKRQEGERFGTYWILQTEHGQEVARSAVEPFGFGTGARALTTWARENGHEIVGGGVHGEPGWA